MLLSMRTNKGTKLFLEHTKLENGGYHCVVYDSVGKDNIVDEFDLSAAESEHFISIAKKYAKDCPL